MWFCKVSKEAYTRDHMKKHITILIGLVALSAVLYGGETLMNKKSNKEVSKNKVSEVGMMAFTGEVTRMFEGENKLMYSFDIPENATTSLGMDNALVKVTNQDGSLVAAVYFSYEGGRGYTPEEYIDNVIAPKVSVIETAGTSSLGEFVWREASSPSTEWHVGQVLNGNWLVVVENKKTDHGTVEKMLTNLTVK
jgi:hypothetical protein